MPILNVANLKSTITYNGDTVDVNTKSNTHRAENVSTDIVILKTSSKNWALPKDQLQIKTTFTNNSSLEIENITILDTLSSDASFVAGSVEIGSQKYENVDPTTGFTLPISIAGFGAEMEMTYLIEVNAYPESNAVTDKTQLTVTLDNKNFNINSNEASIDIVDNEIWINKSADTVAVQSGDIITYTITIENNGTFTNTNLLFTDEIPEGTTFVTGSVKVNNEEKADYAPNEGFSLDDLAPNATITVEFKVKVN